MLNCLTLCQYFVNQPLELACKKIPKSIIYYYVGNILIATFDINIFEKVFTEIYNILYLNGDCKLLLKKPQRGDNLNYLGFKLIKQKI